MKLKLLSCIFTICFFGILSAQNYPVTVVPQAVSPSPIYFSSYADAGTINSPLRVQLLLNDITLSNVEVRLKTYFEGNGIRFESNDAVVGANPIYLEGGVPVNLTNIQLAPFYSLQNISGINPNQYGEPIPEGSYQFCFEVYDAFTGNRLSARSCATTYIFKNEPPFLVLPRRDETIDVINPQNIVFQWTPRHINVSNVEYELSIVEIWDNYVDPQAAFFSMPPIFQATTRNTSYLLGPADPLLLPNKKYAWRVQAKAISGTEEIGLFNNNGYSEIYWFTHSQPCEVPANVRDEVKGTHQANIEWDDFSTEIPEYKVRYREKNSSPAGAWFYSRSNTNWVTIWDLRPGTTYEYQVNRKCQLIESEYSPVKTFTTFLADDESGLYNCGISPEINITNADPLPDLFVNDVFKAGDFPIKVLEVSGSNGRFTGKGYVNMPYLKNIKVAVEFTNILINTDKDLIEGMVITKYDPTWSNILDVDGVIDSVEDITDVFTGGDNTILDPVDYDIKSVTIKDGQIVVTGTNGEQTTYDYDEGDTYQISGTNGVFAIDKDGNVSQIGETAEGGPATAENTEGINPSGSGTVESPSVSQVYTEGVTVIFRKGTKIETRYELDMVDNSFEQSTYPKAQRSDGTDYYPVHKAVVNGNKDIFYADITITNNEINIDSLIFKTVETGLKITNEKVDNDTYKIEVEGRNAYRNEEAIIAYKDASGKQVVIASFFIHHLHKLQTRKVQIVSVNGAPPIEGLEETLKDIFGVAGASFDVNSNVHEINISPSVWDIDEKNDILDYNGSGLLPDYPREIRAIHQYYMANTANYDRGAYYLFLVDESIKVSKPINGFMPKGRQFGYIFNAYKNQGLGAKDEQDKVVAHELGHGVFSLEHPFESDSNAGNTKWLMDYADGTQLPFAHWAVMSNTGLNLQLFQPDEGGESVITSLHPSLSINKKRYRCEDGKCEENQNGKYYFAFLAPDGRRIVLSEDYLPIFYHGIENDKYTHIVPGTLLGFIKRGITPDQNIKYRAVLSSDGLILEGFNGYNYIPPPLSDDDKSVVVGIPFAGNHGSQGKWKNYKFFLTNNILNYDNSESSVMNILSDEFKNIGFFNNLKPSEVRTLENTANILGEEQYSVTESELSILRGRYFEVPGITDFTLKITGLVTVAHEEKPEVFLLIKIAELENRYRVLFENHSKWFDNWHIYALLHDNYLGLEAGIISEIAGFPGGYWDKENIKSETIANSESLYNKWKNNLSSQAGSSQLYDFYRSFITSLRDYTDNRSEENFDCLANLGEQTAEKIFECVATASDDEIMTKIDQPNRQKALKTLAAYGGEYDVYLDAGEDVIRRLIKYVPETGFQEDEFLNYLANATVSFSDGSEVPVWKLIFDKVDDSRFLIPNSDNRNAVIYQLLKLYYKSDKYKNQLNDILNGYQEKILDAEITKLDALKEELYPFKNEYQNILRRSFTYVKSFSPTMGVFFDPEDYYFSLDATYDEQTKKIDLSQQLKWGFDGDPTHIEEDKDPFDLKLMLNLSRNALLTQFNLKNEDGKPESLPLPAIVLYYVSEVDGLQTKEDIIQTSIDLVTLPLPAANATRLARVFYYADKISSVSSLMGTYNREGNEELAGFYNKLSIVTGVTSIGDVFLNSNKTLRTVIDQKSLTKNSSDLLNDSMDFIETIDPNSVSKLNDAEKNVAREILKDNLEDFKEFGIIDAPKILKFENAISALNQLDAFTGLLRSIQKTHSKLHAELVKITDGTVKLRFVKDFGNSLDDLSKLGNDLELLTLWKKWGDPEDELIKLTGKRVADIDDLKYLKLILNKPPPAGLNSFEDFYKKSKWQISKVDDPKFAARCYEALMENSAIAASEKLLKIYDDYASVLKVGGKYDWPVNDGFHRITKTDAPVINSHFDRFDNNQEISGSFASPIESAVSSPTHSSRALKENFSDFSTPDDDYYHHLFEVVKNDAVTFEYGTALPWFGKLGEAEQIKSNLRLADLLDAGKIKIIKTYHFTNGKWLKHVDDIVEKLGDVNLKSAFRKDWEDTAFRKLFENASDAEVDGLLKAWKIVQNGPELLRTNPENLEKLIRFMKETGMEESKLISSFSNTNDPQKWVDMKIPESELDATYDAMKNSPLDELIPWTKEHKAQRWANHKSGNPDANFNSWSNKYDGNIKKADAANSGVNDYYNLLGWNCSNCKEVTTSDITILTDNGLQTLSRRHDIADKSPNVKKAIEIKEYSSGKVYYSEKSIKTQVALDTELLESKEFLSIEWVFKGCEPSKPLEDALIEAGITIKRIP